MRCLAVTTCLFVVFSRGIYQAFPTGRRAVFQKGGCDGDARAQDDDSLTIFHGKRLSGYAAARGVWRVHITSGDNDVIGNENFGKRVLKGPPLLDTVRLLCYDCRERKEGGYGPKPKLVSLNGGGGGGSAGGQVWSGAGDRGILHRQQYGRRLCAGRRRRAARTGPDGPRRLSSPLQRALPGGYRSQSPPVGLGTLPAGDRAGRRLWNQQAGGPLRLYPAGLR